MITNRILALLVLALTLVLVDTTPAWAQGPVKVGDVLDYSAASPHPYPQGTEDRPVVWSEVIRSEGATWLRLHFKDFEVALEDYVTIQAPGGAEVHRYEGRGPYYGDGEFWSFSTEGDTAIVRIHGGLAACRT